MGALSAKVRKSCRVCLERSSSNDLFGRPTTAGPLSSPMRMRTSAVRATETRAPGTAQFRGSTPRHPTSVPARPGRAVPPLPSAPPPPQVRGARRRVPRCAARTFERADCPPARPARGRRPRDGETTTQVRGAAKFQTTEPSPTTPTSQIPTMVGICLPRGAPCRSWPSYPRARGPMTTTGPVRPGGPCSATGAPGGETGAPQGGGGGASTGAGGRRPTGGRGGARARGG